MNKCFAFSMASKQKESGKIKRVSLSIGDKLDLIKKLDPGVSVVRVCDEHRVRKENS